MEKIIKFLFSAVLLMSAMFAEAQTLVLYKDGEAFYSVPASEVDSIGFVFEQKDTATKYEYVDLGLPSGTLWATCNVGATKPEEVGDYFAWGETETKEEYTKENYKLSFMFSFNDDSLLLVNGVIDGVKDTTSDYRDYTHGRLTEKYDAATVNMGAEWRMPTLDEMTEMYETCTYKPAEWNGVSGMEFTGPNGNTLFLPMWSEGSLGYYWTSSFSKDTAFFLDMYNWRTDYYGLACELDGSPTYGQCVRAVRR